MLYQAYSEGMTHTPRVTTRATVHKQSLNVALEYRKGDLCVG